MEKLFYTHIYSKSALEQVLFSIGLIYMADAAVQLIEGSQQQFINLPDFLKQRYDVFGVGMGAYRLLIIAVCGVVALSLQLVLTKTRFGSRLRAAVDDRRVARGLGINVNLVFAATFAVGSGLAGLGGALGAEILGLDPTFPLKYMIYFLIVVTVGGTSSITGPFLASLLLGIADVTGKYYIPDYGAFVIYTVMLIVLIWRPQGLFGRVATR
jgi:branched-chain amino acid transport system permease protein